MRRGSKGGLLGWWCTTNARRRARARGSVSSGSAYLNQTLDRAGLEDAATLFFRCVAQNDEGSSAIERNLGRDANEGTRGLIPLRRLAAFHPASDMPWKCVRNAFPDFGSGK